jgi:hypothetical protein
VTFLAIYTIAGLLFALWFVALAAPRIDPAAKGAGLLFRLLIFPGSAALWPLLLLKCRSSWK